jgi:hypothetical protein
MRACLGSEFRIVRRSSDVFAVIVEDRVVIWCSEEDFPGQDMNAIRKLCKTKTLQEGLEMVELYGDKLTLRL